MNLTQARLPSAAAFDDYHGLFKDCFPETAGTSLQSPEHYRWKYGPAGKTAPSFEFGAWDGSPAESRMIGYYAALPLAYQVAGAPSVAGLVCDVMTHSSMRGKGVFTKQGFYATDEMAQNGIDFCTGYPIRPEVIPGHIKVGWKIAFPLPVYFKMANPGAVLKSRGLGALNPFLKPLFGGYNLACKVIRPQARGATCDSVDPAVFFGSREYAQFYQKWATYHPNHLVRSAAFFGWRLKAPTASYTLTIVRRDNLLAGLAITRTTALSGFSATGIVEFMILPEHRTAAGALHDELLRIANRQGTIGVVAMVTEPQVARWMLLRNGYLKSPVKFELILKWLAARPEPASFWDAAAWHLTWADTDNL